MKKKISTLIAFAAGVALTTPAAFAAVDADEAVEAVKKNVEFYGTVETDAIFGEDFSGASTNDIQLATADFGMNASLASWVNGTLGVSWDSDESKFDVDDVFILLGGSEEMPMTFKVGRFTVPFGVYESSLISDPLTKEAFKAKEDAAMIGFEQSGLHLHAFAFNGDTNEGGGDSSIDQFGAAIGYGMDRESVNYDFTVGYTNSIADGKGITGYLKDMQAEADANGTPYDANKSFLNDDYIGGVAFSAMVGTGPVTLVAEYVTALDDYKDQEWKAWHLEADFTADLSGHETVFALGWSGTDEMGGIVPETRLAGTITVGLIDGLSSSIEYCHDEDYAKNDGGTDESADTVTMRLSLEF